MLVIHAVIVIPQLNICFVHFSVHILCGNLKNTLTLPSGGRWQNLSLSQSVYWGELIIRIEVFRGNSRSGMILGCMNMNQGINTIQNLPSHHKCSEETWPLTWNHHSIWYTQTFLVCTCCFVYSRQGLLTGDSTLLGKMVILILSIWFLTRDTCFLFNPNHLP